MASACDVNYTLSLCSSSLIANGHSALVIGVSMGIVFFLIIILVAGGISWIVVVLFQRQRYIHVDCILLYCG